MTTKEFQESSAWRIFFSYFKPHRKLFFLDMCCALVISLIDLAFPYISRWCMYELLPQSAYRTFFAVMASVICSLLGGVILDLYGAGRLMMISTLLTAAGAVIISLTIGRIHTKKEETIGLSA